MHNQSNEFGNVEFLVTIPPPKKDIFFLADHFVFRDGIWQPRYYPSKYSNSHATIFEAARECYPKDMLPSDSKKLYVIVDSAVIAPKTKKLDLLEI